MLLDENLLIAGHEVGHYLLSRIHGFPQCFVTITRGRDFSPHASYDLTRPTPKGMAKAEVLLAGWAGETYVMTQRRDSDHFDHKSFVDGLWAGKTGIGWPMALIIGGNKDLGQLGRLGMGRFRWFWPRSDLAKIGHLIYGEKMLFYKLIDNILLEYSLCEEALTAITANQPWTPELRSRNQFQALSKLQILHEKRV